GCVSLSTSQVVTTEPNMNVTVSGSLTFCAGSSVTFTASAGSGYAYQWKKNNVDIAGATGKTYTATTAGNYKVRITTTGGCVGNSASQSVVISCRTAGNISSPPLLNITAYPNPFTLATRIQVETDSESSLSVFIY